MALGNIDISLIIQAIFSNDNLIDYINNPIL